MDNNKDFIIGTKVITVLGKIIGPTFDKANFLMGDGELLISQEEVEDLVDELEERIITARWVSEILFEEWEFISEAAKGIELLAIKYLKEYSEFNYTYDSVDELTVNFLKEQLNKGVVTSDTLRRLLNFTDQIKELQFENEEDKEKEGFVIQCLIEFLVLQEAGL